MDKLELTADFSDVRIDKYLSEHSELSRTRVQALCKEGLIKVNGEAVKSSYKLSENDVITAEIPEDQPMDLLPENIPLDILYEDSDLIVINKPKGMIVHPAPGVYSGTLVNALLYHCKDLSGINGTIRPGIVHRIDKDTTGCIVACKNDFTHEGIAKQLEDKTCHREYRTIVMGNLEHDDGLIDAPIGRDPNDRQKMKVTDQNSRDARTHFKVLERFKDSTYAECALETGRTHQIRVHMKFIGHPVMGDLKYGKPCKYMDTQGQVLHAYRLTFIHPRTGEKMTFEADLPEYFQQLLEKLRKESE
ncbi:MAG: RluA family pseudouridine synthase [Solobacterium sp.]|jgi:23S rRNA pseudouridine1911/1915/1917 synthase|nr:RluA family pseudouridine synthase [Solobacterium sp.]MCH4222683.1 RluA family pseudouridine synthase [Solobacterium sp.]MCH4265283.1 RluA family pseudouridine synthase [Solobacterium sp.]